MIFLFSIVAFVTSALAESVSTILGKRADQLKRAITGMIGEADARKLFSTEMIKTLENPKAWGIGKVWRSRPSYISCGDFSAGVAAVIGLGDKISEAGNRVETAAPDTPIDEAKAFLDELDDGPIKDYLTEVFAGGTAKLDEINEYLNSWYDNVMERVTGWYKRWVNVVVFVIAFVLAAGLNINSIVVADALWDDPLLRSGVEAAVAAQIEDTQSREGRVDAEAIVAELEQLVELGFPVGWTTEADDPRFFGPWTILGWLITAAAATLGAPFWFDLLRKVANLRGSGTVPATAPESTTPDS
jgi:hypothetical protein